VELKHTTIATPHRLSSVIHNQQTPLIPKETYITVVPRTFNEYLTFPQRQQTRSKNNLLFP
jgi:hypothetical protein